MVFSTPVNVSKPGFELDASSSILMLGSCFADKIGNLLVENKFNCTVNPFGVLYNPASVFHSLQMLLDGSFDENKYLFNYDGEWRSWMHSTDFSSTKKDECLKKIESAFLQATRQMNEVDVVFITLGTNKYYYHKQNSFVVANCHKCPSTLFDEKSLELDEIVELGSKTITLLLQKRPDIHIVFTVSPYRYRKYGFHESQLSKSVLLLAIDSLCKLHPENTVYFPAYEIVNDELRDYRFYAADMLHPSEQATTFIWEKFSEVYLSADTKEMVKEWTSIAHSLGHTIMTDDNNKIKIFYENLLQKISDFSNKYNTINVKDEINLIKEKLI